MSKNLSLGDIERVAKSLGVTSAVIRTVVAVETNGSGFLRDGRPKILFERHWFWKLTPLPVSKTRPDLSNPNPGGYVGGTWEWNRLNDAIAFDRIAALKSASWGLGQIMGFNHAAAGYADIDVFVQAMHHSEGKQIEAMMQFIKSNPQMHSALRDRRWQDFAQLYNGPAYKRNAYDTKLAAAYKRYLA